MLLYSMTQELGQKEQVPGACSEADEVGLQRDGAQEGGEAIAQEAGELPANVDTACISHGRSEGYTAVGERRGIIERRENSSSSVGWLFGLSQAWVRG